MANKAKHDVNCRFQKTAAPNVRSRMHYSSKRGLNPSGNDGRQAAKSRPLSLSPTGHSKVRSTLRPAVAAIRCGRRMPAWGACYLPGSSSSAFYRSPAGTTEFDLKGWTRPSYDPEIHVGPSFVFNPESRSTQSVSLRAYVPDTQLAFRLCA